MKLFRFVFLIITLLIGNNSYTQSYTEDLVFLRKTLEKTKSFQDQIKGEKLKYFDSVYHSVLDDSLSEVDDWQKFQKFSKLFFPIKDNHIGFYSNVNYEHFKSQENLEKYMQTEEFKNYPSINIDIDSLKKILLNKPIESPEGIYYYADVLTVGVYQKSKNEFEGIILESKTALWKPGQLAIYLNEFEPGLYKAIYAHPIHKNFIFHPIEKKQNGRLVNSVFYSSFTREPYSKIPGKINYADLPSNSPRFEMRNINDKFQYLLIRSFQNNTITSRESQKFHDSVINQITAPNLIIDLRNNEGGQYKQSKKFLKLARKHSKKGKVYLLINHHTLSQAEIFTLKLKNLKNIYTAGLPTRGMLSYGSNYGKRITLPTGKYTIYPTDMKGRKLFLKYENYGIQPEIILKPDSDWLEQIIRM